IKSMLQAGYSFSAIIQRIPGVKKTTIADYKRKFFPDIVGGAPGRKSVIVVYVISATTRSYIRKQLVLGNTVTHKTVHMF
ncbi:hypothetical protein BDF20DRAFT_790306, partial [Mycotypha africana]|uniref:uncharacterized protein n=1 Tax=Mycotypha africana TaxID=64632 RepID=UPI002301DE83